MKNLTRVVFVVIMAVGMTNAETVDRIIAKINDEIITLSELRREMEPYRREIMGKVPVTQLEQVLKETEERVLDSLIEAALIYQKAIELEYDAHVEEDVTSYIRQIMKENNFRDTEEFENALAQEGQSLISFRESIERQAVSEALVYEFINARISLLTPEIERYYQNHLADFSSLEEVTLSEIVLDATQGVSEAESLAFEIADRVRHGESFAILARQYSKGSTAGKGGEIGTYDVNKLNAEIRKMLVDVEEGHISAPQKTDEGIILYHVDARKPVVVKPLDEVRDEIRNILYQQKRNPEYERFIIQLKEDAFIQIFPEMQ